MLTDKEKAKKYDEGQDIPNVMITPTRPGIDYTVTKEEYSELIINREMKRKLKKWQESIQIPTDDSIAPLFNDVKAKIKEILSE